MELELVKITYLLFILKNILRMCILIVCVSIFSFVLVSISPIDPVQANIGQVALGTMSREQVEKLELYWGVGEPLITRYVEWAKDFFRGDMGVSLLYRQNVSDIILEKLHNSLMLMTTAWIISGVFGFILGIIAGANQGSFVDKLIKTYSLLIASTPAFWLALVLIMVFSVWLNILPIGFGVPIGVEAANVTLSDRIRHIILPALTLGITGISNIALHTRAKMIDVMQSDYVLFAMARGESKWSIIKNHGIRNVSLPAITLQFASISEIFGGSILVEQIFSYPGLGQTAVTAGIGSDVPLLLGIAIISATIVFVGNFIANILYVSIDPRIRRGL